MLTHLTVRIGDRARFPLTRLYRDDPPYNRDWAVWAFTRDGLIIVRRRHDGLERIVNMSHWAHWAIDEPRHAIPGEPRRALPRPPLNADRTRPGFYVSARQSSGKAYVLLAGPFDNPSDARRWEPKARHYVASMYEREYDSGEIAIGVCRAEDGQRDGRFNRELEVRSCVAASK